MQVVDFHRSIGERIAVNPELLEKDNEADRTLANDLRQLIACARADAKCLSHLNRRVLMSIEELAEWVEAHVEDDLTAAADAWGDRMYILLGDAVATGLPAERILSAVHQSNMTKSNADERTGKGVKSSRYENPKLTGIFDKPLGGA